MEFRLLGKTGLRGSVIGFGCNRIASGDSDRKEVIATLESALDLGINLFDTADSYDHGESERLLGSVVRHRRDRTLLCSKAGYRWWAHVLLEKWIPFPVFTPAGKKQGNRLSPKRVQSRPLRNFSPRVLSLCVEASLRRLQSEYLDIFYLHSPPSEVLAEPLIFESLEKLRQKGWIRYYGVSFAERTPTDLIVETSKHPNLSVLQFQFNPAECVDLPRLVALSSQTPAMVARQPFQRGTLLGASPASETQTAADSPKSTPQRILRSVLQQPGTHSVLVGMRSRQHLQENVSALETPLLSPQEMERLYSSTRIY